MLSILFYCKPRFPLFPIQAHYSDECKFKETLLANNYNAYESMAYPGMYIGLSRTGKTKKGNRVSTAMTVTHFLPRIWTKTEGGTTQAANPEGKPGRCTFHKSYTRGQLYRIITIITIIIMYISLFIFVRFIFPFKQPLFMCGKKTLLIYLFIYPFCCYRVFNTWNSYN